MASELEGSREAIAKLRELASPKEGRAALTAAVRRPMQKVKERAEANIAAISPGKAQLHRTYKGRLVSAGFAARNVIMAVKWDDRGRAYALLGTAKEAFYAFFFELGTSSIPARPWLLPAFESMKGETLQMVAAVLRERVNRIAKKRAGGK